MMSSGDLIADRRFAHGELLSQEGDHAAAADLFTQSLERAPEWAPAWMALGLAHERNGDRDAALTALGAAAALDLQGRLGASLHQARLAGRHPEGMPPQFLAGLFDQYADRFEHHLVETLAYRGPALIRAALLSLDPELTRGCALDLGCGTGLMARAIATCFSAIDGIDLSSRMVAHARMTGLYRELKVADLVDGLRQAPPDSYDVVLAADVFVYLGVLEEVIAAATAVLSPRGLLAFTVQTTEIEGFVLGADMRFSHNRSYVSASIEAAGLRILTATSQWARREANLEVPGLVVVARKA